MRKVPTNFVLRNFFQRLLNLSGLTLPRYFTNYNYQMPSVISFHKFSDTLFGEIPTFMCGDTDDKVGDCTHTTALSVLLTESCFCEGELCNSVNATFPKEKAMSGAGSVHPAAAIIAATVVAIAASMY